MVINILYLLHVCMLTSLWERQHADACSSITSLLSIKTITLVRQSHTWVKVRISCKNITLSKISVIYANSQSDIKCTNVRKKNVVVLPLNSSNTDVLGQRLTRRPIVVRLFWAQNETEKSTSLTCRTLTIESNVWD